MNSRFVEYDNDINAVWCSKLQASYYKIRRKVWELTGKDLNAPVFAINNDMGNKWGVWNPKDRTMTFSGKLLRNFEWQAVEHVMKHEVAHQIVSEIFAMDCYGVSHGEFWARACKIVDIDPSRCMSSNLLAGFKGLVESPMVDKVRKLLVHGNDRAATKEESQLFLNKAQELIIRHNISMREINGSDRFFIQRPVGKNYGRLPSWSWDLAEFVSSHYSVKYIQTYIGGRKKRIEFFGEPNNLDIAEYIYHALLNQAEILYAEYRANHKIKMKTDAKYHEDAYYYGGKVSKVLFFKGLISGYSQKLGEDKKIVMDKIKAEDGAIVALENDRVLQEMYNNVYVNRKTVSLNYRSSGTGYSGGHEAGINLRLAKAVSNNGNVGNLISA